MAQVIKKNNDLKRQARHCKSTVILSWLASAVCFVLLFLNIFLYQIHTLWIYVPLVVGIVISGVIHKITARKYDILRAGLEGENVAVKRISECLPKNYYIFQNVKVSYEGKTSEIDMVVVGKTGVYIIEVKNHKGTIVGRPDAQYWEQRKLGDGTLQTKEFYSPIKQVGTHVYRLAKHLRENGIRVHVDSIVYFSNQEADLRIAKEYTETPVFAECDNGGEELVLYIMGREQVLSNEMINKIYRFLCKS